MKTYHEMADSALRRIEESKKIRNKKKEMITRVVIPVFSCCFLTLIGIGIGKSTEEQTGFISHQPPQPNGINAEDVRKQDIVVTNQISDISSDKINIHLMREDFIQLSESELADYYGMDVYPTVPSDLMNWAETDDFSGYGIFRRDKGRGEVYWDQIVLNYSNSDYTRIVNIEVAKNELPVLDYGIDAEWKKSTISDCTVYLGVDQAKRYQARLICNQTGFIINATGLTQEEIVGIIKSIIE